MAYIGLPDNDDKSFEFYYSVIEKYSELIDETKESIVEQGLEVYGELMRRLKAKS
jgi:predicted secreted protein